MQNLNQWDAVGQEAAGWDDDGNDFVNQRHDEARYARYWSEVWQVALVIALQPDRPKSSPNRIGDPFSEVCVCKVSC